MPKNPQKQYDGVKQNVPAKPGSANKIATGQMEPKFVKRPEKHSSESIPMEEVQMAFNKLTKKRRSNELM